MSLLFSAEACKRKDQRVSTYLLPDAVAPVVIKTLPEVPLAVDPVPINTVPLTPPAEAVPGR